MSFFEIELGNANFYIMQLSPGYTDQILTLFQFYIGTIFQL